MYLNSSIPTFSFLVPTRNNLKMLGNFLDSIVDTTKWIDNVEVVLCADSDDEATLQYSYSAVRCVQTVMPPGSTMGELNNRCFQESSGEYVMLLNDDVLLQTKGWDVLVAGALNSFSDRHLLIHVNDLIFGSSLCTFPMLSRRSIGLVGFCPAGFQRYGIDDHIMDIFHILRSLGHERILYQEDVVFEHLNYHMQGKNDKTRSYVPKTSPEKDWQLYNDLLGLRKKAALALAVDIDGHHDNENRYRERLEMITADKAYRKLEPLLV